jgi:hypothetical protein
MGIPASLFFIHDNVIAYKLQHLKEIELKPTTGINEREPSKPWMRFAKEECDSWRFTHDPWPILCNFPDNPNLTTSFASGADDMASIKLAPFLYGRLFLLPNFFPIAILGNRCQQ